MQVALCTVARDEDRYLAEWLDYNIKLGFDRVFVYQHNWRYGGDRSKWGNRVEWVEFDGEKVQIPAFQDFIGKHGNEYDFAAFFDVDEFLVLKRWDSITVKDELSHFADVDVVSIPWRCFGDGGMKDEPNEGESWSVVDRFLLGRDIYERLKKCILNLKKLGGKAEFVDPHYLRGLSAVDPARSCVVGHSQFPPSINEHCQPMELFHYKAKTLNEYIRRTRGGDAYFGGKRWQLGDENAKEPTDEDIAKAHRSMSDIWNKELHFEAYNFLHDAHRCEQRYDVAFIADRKYLPYAKACIASLIETTSVPLCIHVVSDGLSDSEKRRLAAIRTTKNVLMDVTELEQSLLDGYGGRAHLSKGAFAKLFLPSILPSVERVLYLDCDMIVKKDLRDVFSTDMGGKCMAAVKDFGINCIWRDEDGELLPGVGRGAHVNCGFMLMDLSKMRKGGAESLFRSVEPKSTLCDQYVINKALEGQIAFVSPKFNVSFGKILDERHRDYLDVGKFNTLYGTDYDSVEQLVGDACVFHYHGNKSATLKGKAVAAEYGRCAEMAERLFA